MYDESTEAAVAGTNANDVVIVSTLKVEGKEYSSHNYFVKQGALNFPKTTVKAEVAKCDGGVEVTLSADNFARAVYLSVDGIDNFFEDNYFDLLPGASRTIKVKTKLSAEEFEKQLKVMHLGGCKESKGKSKGTKIANDEEVHFVS